MTLRDLDDDRPAPSSVTCPSCAADAGQIRRRPLVTRASRVGAFEVFIDDASVTTYTCEACGTSW